MLRSTHTATVTKVDSAAARGLARALCDAFAKTDVQVAVVDRSLELMGVSAGLADFAARFPGGVISEDVCLPLVEVLEQCFVAGVRGVVELRALPGLSGGPYRIECATWDVPENEIQSERSTTGGRPSGVGWRVALLIVTEQTELNALRVQVEQLNRMESLGMLAGSVAHDFNNLLTGIRGSLALVRHHVSPDGRESALRAAEAAARRAGEVTRRLLSFSKGPELVVNRTEPASVLQETVDLLRCIPDATSVDTDIDADLGLVEMLPSELHQVVLNLLINASDAVRGLGEASGVTLRASTTWRAEPGGRRSSSRWLRISVIDRGPGMDARVRQRIFEPFFTTKPVGRGTGLGLCGVKELVRKAGGWLEVESEPAKGSAFHVYLPLSGGAVHTPVVEPPRSNPVLDDRRVLICDDEGRLGDLTVGLLEEFGYRSQAVLQCEEALSLLTGPNPPKALLLDVNLSRGMSAAQLLEELEGREVRVPVILTSGLSLDDLPESLRSHPRVVSYLAKPYTVAELVDAIRAALELAVS